MVDVATTFTALVGIITGDILPTFAEFPINILVVGMVAGVAFRILRGVKGVAR